MPEQKHPFEHLAPLRNIDKPVRFALMLRPVDAKGDPVPMRDLGIADFAEIAATFTFKPATLLQKNAHVAAGAFRARMLLAVEALSTTMVESAVRGDLRFSTLIPDVDK